MEIQFNGALTNTTYYKSTDLFYQEELISFVKGTKSVK